MNHGRTFRITLSPKNFHELCAAAERRNMPPEIFLREAIELMLRDRLIDAVMDDDIATAAVDG
jgi:hypothetical protein